MNPLLDPALLFFVLGMTAGLLRSNLEIPAPLSRFLSLYLLMALGLKGGFALAQSGLTPSVGATLACAVLLACAIPALAWVVLTRLLPQALRRTQRHFERRRRLFLAQAGEQAALDHAHRDEGA